MQRRWVLVVGALLALVAALYLTADPLRDGAEDATLDELLQASRGGQKQSGTRNATPVLVGGPAGEPGETVPDGAGGRTRGPAAQAGPATFIVISHETAQALEKIALQDAAGNVLALTNEEGLAQIERVPAAGIVLRAVGTGYVQAVLRARPGDLTEIALRPGIKVVGHIVRAGKRGDPGPAEVLVWDEDLDGEIASFTTEDSGAFEIGAVRPNRPFLMTVRLSGLVPQVKRIVLDEPTKDLEVLVGEGGHLTGRVHTDADLPLAGVEVRLLRRNEPILEQRGWREGETRADLARIAARVASTHTDEEGRFAFHGIPVDTRIQPVVLAGGRHVVRGSGVSFAEAGETSDQDILIPASARLRIRIADESGAPIGDADIKIRSAGAVWQVRTSDERRDGAVLLRDLTPGPFDMMITRPGAPTLHEQGALVAGEESVVNVTVPSGLMLQGKVENKRGAPIWKALVRWSAADEQVEVRTEMDGRFQFRNLTRTLGVVLVSARDLSASAFGYEDRTVPDAEAGGPALKIVLKDGTRVRGSFRELPAGARVESSMVPGTRYDEARLSLDDEFRFVRRGPLPGQSALFIFRTPGRPPILRPEDAPFQSEEVRDVGPLFFQATNPRKGRILDEQGLPLWAAKVTLETPWSRASVRTDRKGDFVLAQMPRRDLPILIEAEGYPATPLTLSVGSEFKPQLIRLRQVVDLTFQVVTAEGAQARDARLSVKRLTKGASDATPPTVEKATNRRGLARLRLAPGRYEVRAKSRKGGVVTTRVVGVSSEPVQQVRIVLP